MMKLDFWMSLSLKGNKYSLNRHYLFPPFLLSISIPSICISKFLFFFAFKQSTYFNRRHRWPPFSSGASLSPGQLEWFIRWSRLFPTAISIWNE